MATLASSMRRATAYKLGVSSMAEVGFHKHAEDEDRACAHLVEYIGAVNGRREYICRFNAQCLAHILLNLQPCDFEL